MIRLLNRSGHGISYSKLEEIDTALCLKKLASVDESSIPLPETIQPNIPTTLAWDNIDRLEETLSGGGTSHRVNGIVVQPRSYGPYAQKNVTSEPTSKTKQRSVNVTPTQLPTYFAGGRVGRPPRPYVDADADDLRQHTARKNLLWILTRLHQASHQDVSG